MNGGGRRPLPRTSSTMRETAYIAPRPAFALRATARRAAYAMRAPSPTSQPSPGYRCGFRPRSTSHRSRWFAPADVSRRHSTANDFTSTWAASAGSSGGANNRRRRESDSGQNAEPTPSARTTPGPSAMAGNNRCRRRVLPRRASLFAEPALAAGDDTSSLSGAVFLFRIRAGSWTYRIRRAADIARRANGETPTRRSRWGVGGGFWWVCRPPGR